MSEQQGMLRSTDLEGPPGKVLKKVLKRCENRTNSKSKIQKWIRFQQSQNNKKLFINVKGQCPPLNGINLGLNKSDNNNQMIQLTDVICALFISNWAYNI